MQSPSRKLPPEALVFVVDDEEDIRNGLTRLFRSTHTPVETFSCGREFLERRPHQGPSCVVLDVQMPDIDGIELQRTLGRRGTQIVFLTGHGDVPMCAGAMKAGAVDFLTKPVDGDDLLEAVQRALVRSAEARKSASDRAEARTRLGALTPREFEVMKCVIAGLMNKQISGELNAAEKTIKIHRGRVMEKMAVDSVAGLVRIAQTAGVQPHGGRYAA